MPSSSLEGGLLDDAGAAPGSGPGQVLEEAQPEGCELCTGERRGAGNGVAEREHQPIGCGMQDQPELVGDRALAGGPVRGELALVHLDRVLGLASGAVDVFVEMAGLALERGDDIAGIEAARTRLPPGDDAAFAPPGAGGVGEGGAHLLALDAWQIEGQQAIVGHGGRGDLVVRRGSRLGNEFLPHGNGLRYVRHPKIRPDTNNPGYGPGPQPMTAVTSTSQRTSGE